MLLSSLVWLFAGGLKRNEARTPNSSHFVWSSFVRSQKPVINHYQRSIQQNTGAYSQYRGSPMKLANKVAWITGGNSGIGFATARLFVTEGARVAITGRNPKTLQAAAKELGDNVLALQADVTDLEATERAVDRVTKQFGKLDIVFASAGFHELTPIGQTSVEQFERVIRANLTGVFFTIQAAAPHLKEGASIILNGSVQGVLGIPGFTAYAAAKGGIHWLVIDKILGRDCGT